MKLVKVAPSTVVILMLSMSMACASSPQQASEEAPDTQSEPSDEAASASSSGPIIALEYAEGSPPELPEGCKIEETSSTTMLQCVEAYAILSTPLHGERDEAVEVFLAGRKQDWRNAGWTVEEGGAMTLDLDGAEVELMYFKLTQAQRESGSLGGVLESPQLADLRLAVCTPNYGRPFDAGKCAELLDLLTDHVSATRVTGFLFNGEAVEFGEDCVVRDGSVRCGETVLEWTQFDGESATEVPAPEMVANQMRDRGVDVDLESVPCTLADKARECAVMRLSAASYPDQAVVFMDAARDGRSLRLTCDIVAPSDPLALPEPCSAVMDVDFEKVGAE